MTNLEFSLMRQLQQELTDPASKAIVRQKFISLLSKKRKKVYDFVVDQSETNSVSVSRHLNMSLDHSSTALRMLHEYGLLERRPEIRKGRRIYQYSIAE